MRRLVGSVVALVLGVPVVALVGATSVAAATVPPGFSDTAVPGTFSRPTAVEWLPDSRIVVLEQDGRVRIGGPTGGFTTAIDINVCGGTSGERGLLGFTVDPAFLSNGFVYAYYTHSAPSLPGGCANRVSRFTLSGSTIDPASEVVLLDNISSRGGNHNGGNVEIGSDGFLYVSVGDAGVDPRSDPGTNDAAQDLSLLNGKILRITLDGQPAPGNPLTGPNSAPCAFAGISAPRSTQCQEIFAWGLRNPYRFAFDRNDGSDRFLINDVGQSTLEEVDLGAIGANYGWPEREGSCARGATPPCSGPDPAKGYTQPITEYGRSDGQVITGGAFVPNGLWPEAYDGAYFFGDGGSGDIWVRFANGSVDYAAPYATGAGGLSDMTFGFDANGRMVLYYVAIGGGLRKVTPTTPAASSARSNLRMLPVTPFRAYDTGPNEPAVGVAPGKVFNGTTRRVDLDPPGAYEAALVNVTYDSNAGAGFVRLWGTQALRPVTSSLNADAPGTIGANAAIVPLDSAGRFMLEASLTGRVIVDVMAWLDDTGGAVSGGRFAALTPERLVDTRVAAGTALESGSDNPFSRPSADLIEFDADGRLGVPSDGTASAVVLSVGAVAGPGPAGFAGAFPTGTAWSNTSNINVVSADIRANMVVVPLGTNGHVSIKTLNIADAVIDVLGYITSGTAPASTSGRYSSIDPIRIVDTRTPLGFGSLGAGTVASVAIPNAAGAAAVVQNVTVTGTSGPGWVATFPESSTPPFVSNQNYVAADQIRAALAFTSLPASKSVSYRSLVPTDLVVDVVGTFSA
jgi:glucose/arabinose dehydrogenase